MIQPLRPPALALLRQGVLAGIVGVLAALAWLWLLTFSASGAMCTLEGLGCVAFAITVLPLGMLATALVAFGLMYVIGVLRAWQVGLLAPFAAAAFVLPLTGLEVVFGDVAPPPAPFIGIVVLAYVIAGLVSLPGVRRAWPIGVMLAMYLAVAWCFVSLVLHVGTPATTP